MTDALIESTLKSTTINDERLEEILPQYFPVSVVMQSKPSSNQWVDEIWDAVGLVVFSDGEANEKDAGVKNIQQQEGKQLIYSGLKVNLHLDECESYYHNLMSPKPSCFIVAREEDEDGNDTDVPIPFLVSMSFDEAHAYLEGDDIVYAVPIPAELYQWTEAFVIQNYSAEKRKKRKRKDWRKGE